MQAEEMKEERRRAAESRKALETKVGRSRSESVLVSREKKIKKGLNTHAEIYEAKVPIA